VSLIRAVVVNHNTSRWTELVVRSLFARHPDLDIELTVYDNASTDDSSGLRAAAARFRVPVVQSGFTTSTTNNSHGDVLRAFVLDPANAECAYYLFLDTDVCFTRPGTLDRLLEALAADDRAFGAGPRMSWDGETEQPEELATDQLYDLRLHPCCALVRNTPAFRRVVAEVGMSCATYHWAEHDEYFDTFTLLTKVMRTHGQHHVITDALVMHAFGVSYPNDWEATLPAKIARRDAWLARLTS
jgi:GT2 family glycosyltransferase